MTTYRTARIIEVLQERPGFQRVRVAVEGQREPARAYVLTDQIGPAAADDEVIVNTTAVDRHLGTGGWHVVHWNLTRRSWVGPSRGHVMKLRYTSGQADTGAYEEHHPDLPVDLSHVPVVACTVHSQLPLVAAAFAARHPAARLVYVMTDGGALPMALSDTVHALREQALLHATVSAGHAFGGDAEAVTVPSGLAVARHGLGADAIVVAMGPGVVGTGSTLGSTALELAGVVDAAASLGATPIACIRASDADGRARHRGVSHHVRTALGLLSHATALLAVPRGLEASEGLAQLAVRGHGVAVVDVPDASALLRDAGLEVTTMGRGPADDPAFFAFAMAAGVVAADLVGSGGDAP